jgi:(S)-2-hydroxyglutarate dehydrogenase
VIHSGIYYKPGSLKARLCVEGAARVAVFCQEHDLPYRICGKVIVAARFRYRHHRLPKGVSEVCGMGHRHGGAIRTSTKVEGIMHRGGETVIESNSGPLGARYVINCAGLYSDRVSRMSGEQPAVSIVPFRGEYYDLIPGREHLVRTLIYPAPDHRFPFPGIHFTRRIRGGVDAGRNAVLAFLREGYRKQTSTCEIWLKP